MGLFSFFRADFHIMPLSPVDAPAVSLLHRVSFAHGWGEQEILDLLANSAGFGEIAATANRRKFGGFILSRLAADEAEILTLAVAPSYRRLGLGRSLLQRNMQRAKSAGAAAMFLEVDKDNAAAIALYNRFGFKVVGERKGYYRRADGKPATAQVMRAPL